MVKSIPLLSGLDRPLIDKMIHSLPHKFLKEGVILYFPDDNRETFNFLLYGYVSLFSYTQEYRKSLLNILGPGESFGEAVIWGLPHQEYAQIGRPSAKVAVCHRNQWEQWVEQYPHLQINLNKVLHSRTIYLKKRLAEGNESKLNRLLGYLSYAIKTRGVFHSSEIWVPRVLNHDDIGSYINSSRQTVTILLNQLRNEGKIEYDRQRLIIMPRLFSEHPNIFKDFIQKS